MEKRLSDQDINRYDSQASSRECFFVQRWVELLNPKTISTYRVRHLNANQAMIEFRDTIEKILVGFVSNENYTAVREECRELVREDVTLQKHAKPVRDRLLSHLGYGKSGRGDMLRMKYVLEHAIDAVSNYLEWVLSDLEAALSDPNVAESELDSLISSLATETLANGHSQRGLYGLKRVFLTPRSFGGSWSEFRRNLFRRSTYTCCFALKATSDSGTIRDELLHALSSSGIGVVRGSSLVARVPELAEAVSDGSHYLSYQIDAPDAYSAVDAARFRLASDVDFMRFFHLSGLAVSPDCSVAWSRGPGPLKVQEHDSTRWLQLNPLFNEGTASGLATLLHDSSYPNSTSSRFRGALRHHRTASESASPSSRFLSLWVALESFCRCEYSDSLIHGIKDRIPKVLCRRYLYRLLRNYIEDCYRVDPGILGGVVDRTTGSMRQVRNLLTQLQDPQVQALITQRCTSHSLLRHRTTQLNEMFTTPKELRPALRRHCTSLERHLQRLYRIRNMIVHGGDSGETLGASRLQLLTDHLEEYVVEAVRETSHFMTTTKLKDLRAVFARIEDNHNAVLSILDRATTVDIDLVLTGCM